MHPIALQLGHLIAAERMFIEYVSPGLSPELPAGFAENHSLKNDVPDRKLATKDEYVKLWEAQRAATKKALDRRERRRSHGHARRKAAAVRADGRRHSEHGCDSLAQSFGPVRRGAPAAQEADCVLSHREGEIPVKWNTAARAGST